MSPPLEEIGNEYELFLTLADTESVTYRVPVYIVEESKVEFVRQELVDNTGIRGAAIEVKIEQPDEKGAFNIKFNKGVRLI